MIRREFIKLVTAAIAGPPILNTMAGSDRLGPVMPTRVMGRTGEHISAYTIGGAHLYRGAGEQTNQAIIERAIERGIRSFDTARMYDDGHAEKIYGQMLTPRYRAEIFLTSKSTARTGEGLRRDLETSLRALRTDHIDLFQIHAISDPDDVKNRWEGGVVDALLQAREDGLVRYIGFTGHTNPAGHLEMLSQLRQHEILLDSCLMPINAADQHYESFILRVMPELLKDEYGVFAMKTLAGGGLIGKHRVGLKARGLPLEGDLHTVLDQGITVRDLHHFAYALPICSLVGGCESPDEVAANVDTLHAYDGLSEERRNAILAVTEPKAEKYEYYKRQLT